MRHASLLLFGLTLAAAAHGAEKIRYEEIPARLAPFGTMIKAYSIKVTTLDGAVHKSETMELQATEIRLAHEDPAPWETIAGSQVARIEIRRGRRAFDLTADGLITGGLATYSCAMGAFVFCVLGPGILAVSAASALITLIVDGVQLLIPPKVYEIVH